VTLQQCDHIKRLFSTRDVSHLSKPLNFKLVYLRITLFGNHFYYFLIWFEFVGIDLALLVQANHSIMTYGTFGMWGALLAGGLVVYPVTHMKIETMIRYIRPADPKNFILL
jgi:type III secretory pathway component EscU